MQLKSIFSNQLANFLMAKVNCNLHLENLIWKVWLFNFNTMHAKGPFSLSSAAIAKSFHHSKISEFNLSKISLIQ